MARVAVIEERCKGCGYCIAVCAKENLYIDQSRQNRSGYNVATFDPEKDCNGCALCAETCPDVALEVYR
jgi:2-oxoglutarate ferredoxin oxidoreductase subunit delta